MTESIYHVVPKSNWRSKEQKFLPSTITPSTKLAPGQVLFKLSSFNLAANNLTYAVIGETFGYWGYFPDPVDPSLGRVPVWAFADVVKSAVPEIKEGTRVFGYFPMATYHILELKPSSASSGVLDEASEHRSKIPKKLYQRYNIQPTGKKGSKDEALHGIFYIPMLTAYAMERELAPPTEGNTRTVVILSASSKTGVSFAHRLKNGPDAASTKIIGVSSSAASKEFAGTTGYYDDLFTYAEFESATKKLATYPGKVTLYDFAGKVERLAALQEAAGDRLDRTILVGFTDWESGLGGGYEKLVPPPEVFNLPMEECLETIIKNSGGLDSFGKELDKVFKVFLSQHGDKVKIEWKHGPDAVVERWNNLLGTERTPEAELILEL